GKLDQEPCNEDLADEQRDETDVPPAVEDERRGNQPPGAHSLAARHGVIDADGEGHEKEDELLAVKKHIAVTWMLFGESILGSTERTATFSWSRSLLSAGRRHSANRRRDH